MVESTHCIVAVDLAGQEFRRARGHACLVSTVTRTSLLGRRSTGNQMEQICAMELSAEMERGYICANKQVTKPRNCGLGSGGTGF